MIARARERHLALFGGTDMHGLGQTASVWNVMPLPRWRELTAAELSRTLITRFRAAGARAVRVVALRRWVGDGWLGRLFSPPVNAVVQLRAASPAHAVALAVWLWVPYALSRLGRRLRRS
jgi:hypothetical protein